MKLRFPVLAGILAAFLTGVSALTLEEIAADPQQWPAEVRVTAATKAGVVRDGQVSGFMLVGAGRTLAVSGIASDGVTGKLSGVTVRVAVDQTDLMQRLSGAGPRPALAAAAVAEPAAVAPVTSARTAQAPTTMQRLLLGRLVQLENGALRPYDLRKLKGVKFYGIMFSAGWCGPCREFAPHLLESYRSLKNLYPEFELVLVSADRSPADMLAYMREENMPWPAIKFSELGSVDEIRRLGGPGIPCLVLIDSEGKVLADSFRGDEYLGPDSVLDATWRVLKKHRRG